MKRARGRTLVLLYHRVGGGPQDPQQLAVTPDHFSEHLATIGRRAELIPLDQVLAASSADRVAITFDDGYRDNLVNAKPRLVAAGCPATVFVASAYVGARRAFWWDALDHLLHGPIEVAAVRLHIVGRPLVADVRSDAGRRRLYVALTSRLRPLPVAQIEPVVSALAAQLGQPEIVARTEAMSIEDLRDLAGGGVTVGAHTRTHSAMSALTRSEQRVEAAASRRDLEGWLGRKVTQFAYPFGNRGSFTPASERAVKRAGFELACWNVEGRVTHRTHRLRVPRLLIRDQSASELDHRLDTWLAD